MGSERSISGPSDTVQRIKPLHGRTTGPTRRSTKGNWTAEEDEILRKAVERFKGKNWKNSWTFKGLTRRFTRRNEVDRNKVKETRSSGAGGIPSLPRFFFASACVFLPLGSGSPTTRPVFLQPSSISFFA